MSSNSNNGSLDGYNILPEEIKALRRGILHLLDKVNIDIIVAVTSNEPFRCLRIRGHMLSLALYAKDNFQFLDSVIYDNSTSLEDFKSRFVWSDYDEFRRVNPVQIVSPMPNAGIDKAAARRCIDLISQIVNSLLVEEIAKYRQLLDRHSRKKEDGSRRDDYSQALLREVEIMEGVREVYASGLGLLEDFVADM